MAQPRHSVGTGLSALSDSAAGSAFAARRAATGSIRPGPFLFISFLTFLLALACASSVRAADATPTKAADDNRVIIPGATQKSESRADAGSGYGAVSVLGVLVLAGAGAWVLLRGRKLNLTGNPSTRLLNVAETKSLGNRQYLVVATYEDKKFLLGVCPGRIDLLSTLDGRSSPEKTS